jgi:hypothetical protein
MRRIFVSKSKEKNLILLSTNIFIVMMTPKSILLTFKIYFLKNAKILFRKMLFRLELLSAYLLYFLFLFGESKNILKIYLTLIKILIKI